MMDFPVSPTTGQVSNGYVYDGVGWAGGPGVSGPVTEQFFDLGGKTTIDIAVPTWAKSCLIYMTLWNATANAQVNMLISGDGTTFPNGGTDYTIAGFTHLAGGNTYPNQVPLNINRIPIHQAMNNASIPNMSEIHLAVARGPSFAGRLVSSIYDNVTTTYYAHRSHSFYCNNAMGGALQLKALRVYTDVGTWVAGSHIRVRWIGDSAAIPQSNAIADAPSDGGEYTRVNGVWRLKHQRFDLTGLGSQDVLVPSGAKLLSLKAVLVPLNTTSRNFLAYVSIDGTNWCTATSDYFYSGFVHQTVIAAPGIVNLPGVNYATCLLGWGHAEPTQAATVNATLECRRGLSTVHWHNQSHSISFVPGTGYTNAFLRSFVLAGAVGAGSIMDLKKYRFQGEAGGNYAAGSYLSCDWSY